jgi:hypothetical protein
MTQPMTATDDALIEPPAAELPVAVDLRMLRLRRGEDRRLRAGSPVGVLERSRYRRHTARGLQSR